MAEIDIDVEHRRRLPLWMQGRSAANEKRKSGNENEGTLPEDVGPASKARQPKAKVRAENIDKEVLFHDNEPLHEDSSLLVKCRTKKGKRKSSQRDVGCDDPIPYEGGLEKKKAKKGSSVVRRTVQEPIPRKKRNTKSYEPEITNEIENPSPAEEDEELTMEDLMSIAEEYVKADKETEHEKSAATEPKAKTQHHGTISGSSLGDTRGDGRLPTHATIVSTSKFTETRSKNLEYSTNKDIAINPSKTGDPAQDMLDLFLGPLLKKSPSKEKKFEFTSEDLSFTYESQKLRKKNNNGEDVVPLMKKKSSLKDKVAMLLD